MRDEARRWQWSASVVLMVGISVAFVLQQFLATGLIYRWLALSKDGLLAGHVWQLLTFQFLHGNFWHLVGNLLGIWFFGRFIEQRLGAANFLKLYFASGLAGGLLQGLLGLVIEDRFGGPVIGASAGVVGLFAAFAMLEPNAEILLWFILPVKARLFLIFSLVVAVAFMVLPTTGGIAHTAHLGGLLAGMAFIHWRFYQHPLFARRKRATRPRARQPEFAKTASASGSYWITPAAASEPEVVPPEEFISREVDPILDKISAHGIQSLTERERKILEAARKQMERR